MIKTINIESNTIASIFDQLHTQLGGALIIKSNEYILKINNDIAIGTISGTSVENAITYIEFNITFKHNSTLLYQTEDVHCLHFAYCSNGVLFQSFVENKKKNKLTQFQTGIFSNRLDKKSYFYFKNDKKINFSIITLLDSNLEDSDLYDHIQSNFFKCPNTHQFAYISSYNLKIAKKIEELNVIEQHGLTRNLLINSIVFSILALNIEQHLSDESIVNNNLSSLTKKNMERIKEVSEFIKHNPELDYSVKFLTKKTGLPPHKLQIGFKILHNRTVADYIRNARVEVAENLIRTTELNISEIVYSVGLTSKSYFSKIFKEKYGCNPKQYKNQLNERSSSA